MTSPDETLTNSSRLDASNPFVDYALPDWFSPDAQGASCIALPPLVCPGFEWVIPEPVVCPGVDLAPPDPLPSEAGLDAQGAGSGDLIPATGGPDPLIDGGSTDFAVGDGFDPLQPEPAPFDDASFATTMSVGEEGGDSIIFNCWLPPYLPFPDTAELSSVTSFALGEESGDQFDPSGIGLDGKPPVDETDPWLQDWSGESDFGGFDEGFPSDQPLSETEIDPEGSIETFVPGVPLTDFVLDAFDPTAGGSPDDPVDVNLESDTSFPFDLGFPATNDSDLGTIDYQDPFFDFQPIACIVYTYNVTFESYISITPFEEFVPLDGEEYTQETFEDVSGDVRGAGDVPFQDDSLVLPSDPELVPADLTFTTCAIGEESGDGWLDPWQPVDAVIEVDPSSPSQAGDPSDEGAGDSSDEAAGDPVVFLIDDGTADSTDPQPIYIDGGNIYDEYNSDPSFTPEFESVLDNSDPGLSEETFDFTYFDFNNYYEYIESTDDSLFVYNGSTDYYSVYRPILIACFDQGELPLPCEPLPPELPLPNPPIDWTMPYGYTTKAFGEEGGDGFYLGRPIFEKEPPLDSEFVFLSDPTQSDSDETVLEESLPWDGEWQEATTETSDPDPIPLTNRGQDADGVILPWYRTLVVAPPVEAEPIDSSETTTTTLEGHELFVGCPPLTPEPELLETVAVHPTDPLAKSETPGSNASAAGIPSSTDADAAPTTSSMEEKGSVDVSIPVGPEEDAKPIPGLSALPTSVTADETPSVASDDPEQPSTSPSDDALNPIALFLLDSGGPAPNPLENVLLPLLTSKS